MIRPMMVITTRISTSVKPCSPCLAACRRLSLLLPRKLRIFMRCPSFGSLDDLAHRKKRCHYRDDQPTYHDADRNDRGRTADPDHAVEAALQLGLVELGNTAAEHRQLSGLFAQS